MNDALIRQGSGHSTWHTFMVSQAGLRKMRDMSGGKRAADLVIAVGGLVVLSPVILAAAIAVRTGSRGPAIYAQTRLGRDARPFRCYKLRTMYAGTPSVPTHEAASVSITSVGRLLRRLKIDELPQLWNVVRGEMSIVGPRPCLPTQEALIRHREKLGVFAAAPGITGLAQIRGIDMSDPALCARADAEYVRTMSAGTDLRIMLRTFIR